MTETSFSNDSAVARSPSAAHIPAWKKLGLKLKYAKDTSIAVNGNGDTNNDPSTPPPSKKRNIPNGNDTAPDQTPSPGPSNKKRRIDAENESPSTVKTPAPVIPSSSLKKAHSESRRKSVSFTPDTKTRDGESSKDLLKNWEMQYAEELLAAQEERARQDAEAEADAETEPSPNDDIPKRKKEKKKRKEKSGTSTAPIADNYEPPMLAYLNAYYTTRSEWKFRKNMETSLFKHLFSIEKIPPRYNAALSCYLNGLKGDGAKQRLRTSAKDAIKADEPEIQSNTEGSSTNGATSGVTETAKANYEDAIVSFKNSLSHGNADPNDGAQVDPDLKDAFEKRKRAELVLWAVGGTAPGTLNGKSNPSVKSEATNGVKKKRKNRTAVVDISSSSESESLSSDSSGSESEPSSSNQPPNKDAVVKFKKASSTPSASSSSAPSSSSSSSSSSESDSDSPTPSASESESEGEDDSKSSSAPSSASSPSSSSVASSSSPRGVPLNHVAGDGPSKVGRA